MKKQKIFLIFQKRVDNRANDDEDDDEAVIILIFSH